MILKVGRKTPLDGKIEISAADASRLAAPGPTRQLRLRGVPGEHHGEVRISDMPCTCSRGAEGGAHHHHFLESELFRALTPGQEWLLSQGFDGTLEMQPAIPG
jgi:hypothetical protein